MFYSQLILARKGPLGKIWLAAHFDRKLTKTQVFSTDITSSVQSVINPAMPLALRVSGHLMLGIVRIYSNKVKYLMTDCTEAMWKMKLAFKTSGGIDLIDIGPQDNRNIDDNRNFGNVSMDQDFALMENLAFERQLMPLNTAAMVRIKGKDGLSERESLLEQSSSFFAISDASFDGGRVSEIEFVRGEASRQSLALARTSLSEGRKSLQLSQAPSSANRYVDDLPAFDEQVDEAMFAETKFDALDYEPEQYDFPQALEPTMLEPVVEEGEEADNFDVIDMPRSEAVAAAKPKAKPAKKRRVNIEESIEISDRIWKQRLTDVSDIVRRNLGDPLQFKKPSAEREPLPLEDEMDIIAEEAMYCPELMELQLIASNRMPYPSIFALKPEYAAQEEQQLLQRQLEQNSRDSIAEEPEALRNKSSLSFAGGVELPSPVSSMHRQSMDFGDASLQFDDNYGDFNQSQLPEFEHAPSFSAAAGKELTTESREIRQLLQGTPSANLPAQSGEKYVPEPSERTNKVLQVISSELKDKQSISFDVFTAGCTRSVASRFFLEVLQLKTWGKLEIQQTGAYQPISISMA